MVIDVTSVRTLCLEQLVRINPQKQNYFTELEGRLYDWSGKPQTYTQLLTLYYRKYTQLCYNLNIYASTLVARYTPSELLCLNETELNAKVKEEREKQEEHHKRYKQILTGDKDEDKDDQDTYDHGIKCRKCGNQQNISIILRQLRSADEPMSQFLTCGKCGFNWRVG
jgi:DNA-directed RNA polymerase subunit M/transcription elongation factor TFIIS